MADLSKINQEIADNSKLIRDIAVRATSQGELLNPTHLQTLAPKDLPQVYADWLKGWNKFSKTHTVEMGTEGVRAGHLKWTYKVRVDDKSYSFTCYEEGSNAIFETYKTKSDTTIPNTQCLPVPKTVITTTIESMNGRIREIKQAIQERQDTILSFEKAIRENLYEKFQGLKRKLGSDYEKYEALLKKLDSSEEGNNHFEKNLEAELKIQQPYTTHFSSNDEDSDFLANAFRENTEDKSKAITSYDELNTFLTDSETDPKEKEIILKWKKAYDSALKEKHRLEILPKFKSYLELEKQLPEFESNRGDTEKPKDKAEAEAAINSLKEGIKSWQTAIDKMTATLTRLKQLQAQAK